MAKIPTARKPSIDPAVNYPDFVERAGADAKELYDECLQSLTTKAGMDLTVAEFVIEQDWPYLLAQLHRIRQQQENAKGNPQKAN